MMSCPFSQHLDVGYSSDRFVHRGIMVDTARHFLPLTDLKRTIDGMAFVKLNVLVSPFCDEHYT